METSGFKVGDIVEVEVTKIHNFGAVVRMPNNMRGLVHISQVSDDFVKNINDFLKIGDKISARIKKISADGKIDFTLKKKKQPSAPVQREKEFRFFAFQEKMDEFLKKSKKELI
ncbi:MAG: S1 RNA-binding domain-containing protein [Candidatus Omnitrophica bacterium]|nr:S1 RNA-binding domain-containing protein [Candidatus Omnitrophota bacterium]MCG2702763.1 S1 RNA-binding domain-containing protein [Candidatus Omnitrophota bacterium]